MKKVKYFILLVSITTIFSCSKENNIENDITNTDTELFFQTRKNLLKKEFGFSLINALNQSPKLRTLIKTEALKMFNKDYEVLVYSIKDEILENGQTFENLLNLHFKEGLTLIDVLNTEPTLTLLVPELPKNSFSAKSWDALNEIPAVAIRTNVSNKVPMITPNGELGIIPSDEVPGFPILVIKNNERVIANTEHSDFDSYPTKVFLKKNDVQFKFWASNFDNTNSKNSNSTFNRVTFQLDQVLVDAYDIYQQQYPNLNGWQRDYIYYGIQPSNPNGPFSYDFKEHIRSFSMEGDGFAAYNKISDQTGDPSYNNHHRIGTSHWTGGYYEFRTTSLINSNNGVGDQLVNGFSLAPDELFQLHYEIYTTGHWFWKKRWYRLTGITKKVAAVDVPIINWDLDDYSTSIKIHIEEVDQTVTSVITDSRVTKMATNFEFSPSLGEKVKLGLKFGASAETVETHTVQRTFTQGSDDLQFTIVNFADKVILVKNNWYFGRYYITRDYSTGLCKFSLEPKRVQ
jgi:hypothetical protein